MVEVVTANTSTTALRVTFNGIPLTRLIAQGCPANCRDEVWYLVNPSVGTHSISVTTTSVSKYVTASALSFYNVDQATPFGTVVTVHGRDVSSSVSVVSHTGQLVADFYGNQASPPFMPTAGSGQTQQINLGDSAAQEVASSTKAGGSSSTAMTWSWQETNDYADIGVAINSG